MISIDDPSRGMLDEEIAARTRVRADDPEMEQARRGALPIQEQANEETQEILRGVLVHTLAQNTSGYIGENFDDVDDAQSREALQLFSAWRGEHAPRRVRDDEYVQWVQFLREHSGGRIPATIPNRDLPVRLLALAGVANPERVWKRRKLRDVVPALYAGFIAMLEGRENRGEREEGGERNENRNRNTTIPPVPSPRSRMTTSPKPAPSALKLPAFQRSNTLVEYLGTGHRAQMFQLLYGLPKSAPPPAPTPPAPAAAAAPAAPAPAPARTA